MNGPKEKLNVAMIGSGFIAKAHSNAFRQVGHFFRIAYDVNLKLLCGRNEATRSALAEQWGWSETASDWREVIERPDVDVVDIATPNSSHFAIAVAAAKAGKIVLCEKPLAMTVSEAEQMAEAARGRPNLVWFNYRRVPAVALAKLLVEEGRLGRIYHYRAVYLNQSGNDPAKATTWRYRKSESGSGATGDLLSHLLDLALYLNGPIDDLTAMTHTFAAGRDVDDAVALLAHFANGSVGTFEATRYGVGCRNQNAFEIHGSQGMLRFDLEDMNRLVYFDATDAGPLQGGRDLMVTGPGHPYWENFWKPGHAIGYEHTFIATLGDFLGVLESGAKFHPNFDDGLAVQKLMDAVERSARSRGWVEAARARPNA
jgi:predicted dehydrogenase